MKAILNNRFWVKLTKRTKALAKRLYTRKVYDEKACDRCEYVQDRHCDVCDTCPAFIGDMQLYRVRKSASGTPLLGVPTGDRKALKELTSGEQPIITDKRSRAKMKRKLEFTGQLYPNQEKAVNALIKKGYGVLGAPPRAGKTCMAVAVSCKLGLKTLILAAQQEWLDEFYRTYCGNEQEEPMTNAPDIEKFEGRVIVRNQCKTLEDFKSADVCLATYQTFLSEGGKAKLQAIKSLFGLVIVDEAHDTSAEGYSKVIIELNARYKFGLSGTYDRKDGMIFVSKFILGPVTAQCTVETMVPTVKIVETGVTSKRNYRSWVGAMNFLNRHKKRNALIVKRAIAGIKRGHHIVIPVISVEQCKLLADGINEAAGKQIAAAFHGSIPKPKRRQILLDARSGKIKCIVGIRKLVQVGTNVPIWSLQLQVAPISNPPKAQQETARIRTVVPGKLAPEIEHFVEDFGPTKGCFRTMYWKTYVALGFHLPPETKKLAIKYMSTRAIKPGRERIELI